MKYDFDTIIERKNTDCSKWDLLGKRFGNPDAIPFWIADMDFCVPPCITEQIKKRAEHGIFGYTFTPDSYFSAAASWMKEMHGWEVKEDWITYTPGIIPGLNYLIGALTEPGSEIIVQTPVYHRFYEVIRNNGCTVVENPLINDHGIYRIDYEDLERKITEKTKMLLFCSPHNPVGRVWREEELRKVAEIAQRHKILVVSDEAHSDIVYPGNQHTTFATLSPDIEQQCVVCMAPNKTFNIAGLHTANIIIANAEIRNRFSDHMKRLCISSPTIFGAVAQEAAYTYGKEWYREMLVYVEKNVDFAVDYINERIPGVHVVKPEGTYLLWLDFSKLGIHSDELNRRMAIEGGIVFNSGSRYGKSGDGYQRMNVATSRETLKKGLERLEKFVCSL